MNVEYSNGLASALEEANRINKIYKAWENSQDFLVNPIKGTAYKNYILIRCYGQIEKTVRNILADYFTSKGMPQLCIQFGNKIRDRLHASLTKDLFPNFIKNNCSELWFVEIKRRQTDATYRCIKNHCYSFLDAFLGLTSLTNNRNSFAHGSSPYTQSIDDLIVYYEQSIVWLYELDDIVQNFNQE